MRKRDVTIKAEVRDRHADADADFEDGRRIHKPRGTGFL